MRQWYAVRTKTGQEERAVWNLGNQGFDAYLPRYRKRVRHARKTESALRPMFPGYVFVNLDFAAQRWRSVGGTFGVIGFVQFGDAPAPLPQHVIDSLTSREDESGAVRLGDADLKPGDRVRLLDGPFEDCSAILVENSDENRVFLLLDLLARQVRVNVPKDILAKAS